MENNWTEEEIEMIVRNWAWIFGDRSQLELVNIMKEEEFYKKRKDVRKKIIRMSGDDFIFMLDKVRFLVIKLKGKYDGYYALSRFLNFILSICGLIPTKLYKNDELYNYIKKMFSEIDNNYDTRLSQTTNPIIDDYYLYGEYRFDNGRNLIKVGEIDYKKLRQFKKLNKRKYKFFQKNNANELDRKVKIKFLYKTFYNYYGRKLKEILEKENDYNVIMKPNYDKNIWYLEGVTNEVEFSLEVLDEFVEKMYMFDYEYFCRFVDWEIVFP